MITSVTDTKKALKQKVKEKVETKK